MSENLLIVLLTAAVFIGEAIGWSVCWLWHYWERLRLRREIRGVLNELVEKRLECFSIRGGK